MNNIFFTSDTHFDHVNVIKYSNRPFASKEEMNEAMIERWNSVVQSNDTVYHLGDFAFSKTPEKFFNRLNGNKLLVIGNHDRGATLNLPWGWKKSMYELKINKQPIVLCHYAMRTWNRSHYNAVQLYGHSHGTLPGTNQSLDVGVDCWNYKPVSFEEIKSRLSTLKPYKDVDNQNEK